MTQAPNFNDPSLDRLVKKLNPSFMAFQANLNGVSEDIRNLEKWLQASNISIYTSLPIGDGQYIAWALHRGKDWRLVYEYPDLDIDDLVTIPLLETTIRIRLTVRPFLPKLVEAIALIIPASDEVVPPGKPKTKLVNFRSDEIDSLLADL
jgi:hypothetical protein